MKAQSPLHMTPLRATTLLRACCAMAAFMCASTALADTYRVEVKDKTGAIVQSVGGISQVAGAILPTTYKRLTTGTYIDKCAEKDGNVVQLSAKGEYSVGLRMRIEAETADTVNVGFSWDELKALREVKSAGVCKIQAPEIASIISFEGRVSLRTGDRVRIESTEGGYTAELIRTALPVALANAANGS